MQKFAPIVSLRDEGENLQLTPEQMYRGTTSIFGQGLNSGLTSAGGAFQALAGGLGESVGATDFAQQRYAASAAAQARAAQEAPLLHDYRDIDGLRSGGDYLAGKLGELVPAVVTGVAGGALASRTKLPLASLMGATLATTPQMMGSSIQRQQASPEALRASPGERLGIAAGEGLVDSALMNVVPQVMGGRLFRGAGTAASKSALAGKNLSEAVAGNALAGAASETLHQNVDTHFDPNRDTSQDNRRLVDAAATGAIVGAPFGVLGFVGDAARGRSARKAQEQAKGVPLDAPATEAGLGLDNTPEAIKARMQEATAEPVPEPASVLTRVRDAFKSQPDEQADVRAVSEGRDIGVDPEALRTAPPDQQSAMLDAADQTRMEKVGEWAKSLLQDSSITPETQARVTQAMSNLSDRANQATIAGAEMARNLGAKAAEVAAQFSEHAAKQYDTITRGKKLSEENAGLRQIIVDEITPALSLKFVKLRDTPETMNMLADSMRKTFATIQSTGKVDEATASHLVRLFGEDAPTVLAGLHEKIGDSKDPAAVEKFYTGLSEFSDSISKHNSLRDVVRSSMDEKLSNRMTPETLDAVVTNLREYVAGRHTTLPKAQADFLTRGVESELRKYFGPKTNKVLEAFNKDREGALKSSLKSTEADMEPVQTGVHETDVASEAETTQYLGGGKDKAAPELIRSDAAHKAEGFDTQSQAARLLAEAQANNPDRIVKFTKFSELPGEVQAKYKNAGPDDGLVTVEGTKDETRISPDEFTQMRVDTSKTSHAQNNTSRIDTGVKGGTLDARAIVKLMKGKLDFAESDSISDRHRTARAFMEGIAAAQDHMGRTFDIPDSTVLDAKGFTYGEARKLSMRPPDPAWMQGKTDEQINTELGRRDSLKEMSDRELDKTLIRMQDIVTQREQRFNEGVKAARAKGSRLVREDYAEMRRQAGVDDAKSALAMAEREVQGRADEVRRAQNLDDAGRTEVGADEQIHTAADNVNEKELARRTGLDDNALRYDNFAQRTADGSLPKAVVSAIGTKINRLENMTRADGKANVIARQVGQKARALFAAMSVMSRVDQGMFASIVKDSKVSSIAEVVNSLSTKYADKMKGAEPKKGSAFADAVLGKGDITAIKRQISSSKDAALVQHAVDALVAHADNPRAAEVLKAANERMATLVSDPNTAYALQRTNPGKTAGPIEQAQVKDYIQKVLGDSVDVEIGRMLHAGEFVKDPNRVAKGLAEDVVRISVHSLDPLSTAHHEALHAFLSKLREQNLSEAVAPLLRAADSLYVKTRLQELLHDEFGALKQLSNLEERAAYMYQYWAAGKLEMSGKPATMLGRIADMVRNVLGIWSNDQQAVRIMEYFDSGEYASNMKSRSAVQDALRATGNPVIAKYLEFIKPLARLGDAVAATGDARMRDTMIPALHELADKVYAPLAGAHDDLGYIPTARIKRGEFLNELATKLNRYETGHITDALEAMQRGEKGSTPEQRLIVREVRRTLDNMFDYMNKAGVRVNDLGYGKDYFPRVWNPDAILKNEAAFRAMLQHYVDSGDFTGNVDQVIARLTRSDGSDLQAVTVKPGMQHVKERVLAFVKARDAAPFLEKDMYRTLNGYITQATRRAEWARRFDDTGQRLNELMERAKKEGATREHLQTANDYLQGVDGTLGDNINPKLRRAFGNMMVYQNVRLLPLAIFSSLIDPLGIAVRGGTAGDAFKAFKRGIMEIPKGFDKNAVHDEWTNLAASMGVIDNAVLMHTLGSSYSQGMVSDVGRKVNDVFFRYNLMEQYNVSMRVAATESAASFIVRHADGKNSKHSTRWLAELGLRPDEAPVHNGRLLTSVDELVQAGYFKGDAEKMADKMTFAINKWVDGAVLRPNAAYKPIWMNDPHFALIAHLKQFVYAFQETILKRVANEYRHGNLGPAYALASYVPFMIAADMMKGLIVGGGSQPSYKENWDAEDYVWSGVQRAGLFGVGQFGVDAAKDVHRGGVGIGALVGPTVEQLGDAALTVGGTKQFTTFAVNALPANQLFDAAAEAMNTNAMD